MQAELFGSLGATGHGHGSYNAVLWGLEGEDPETVDTSLGPLRAAEVCESGRIRLAGRHQIEFHPDADLVLHRRKSLPFHPNGMIFTAWSGDEVVAERTYYSIGGGFVVGSDAEGHPVVMPDPTAVPYPFSTGDDLLDRCRETGSRISDVMLANECARRSEARGPSRAAADLGGDDRVRPERVRDHRHPARRTQGPAAGRRAPPAADRRSGPVPRPGRPAGRDGLGDPVGAGGERGERLRRPGRHRPHQRGRRDHPGGAALRRRRSCPHVDDDAIVRFLLVAGALGSIYQQTASISGAEVGCQGEVGTACSMAAGALAEILGGTPEQVENAAEIGMEHHLGLTCDPVGGLVQIPCIERNAVASVKAITAARLALHGDGRHTVSLDKVIKTMMETGADMKIKYKETARGGLAVNIVEC